MQQGERVKAFSEKLTRILRDAKAAWDKAMVEAASVKTELKVAASPRDELRRKILEAAELNACGPTRVAWSSCVSSANLTNAARSRVTVKTFCFGLLTVPASFFLDFFFLFFLESLLVAEDREGFSEVDLDSVMASVLLLSETSWQDVRTCTWMRHT